MYAYQGKIQIEKGQISGLQKKPGGVWIVSDNKEYFFKDAYAYPGLKDSHGHIAALGKKLNGLALTDCKSAEECAESASKHKTTQGGWITGFGWNQEKWDTKEYPPAKILDDYLPDIPVMLTRTDGHAVWVNTKAMELAGIKDYVQNPSGGEIIIDKAGKPTGVFVDNAIPLIKRHLPKPGRDNIKDNIIKAMDAFAEAGLTEVHDMDVHPDYLPIYKELDNEGKLKIRVKSFVRAQNKEWLEKQVMPEKFDLFSIEGIKIFYDGALGSRGAAMLDLYSDASGKTGLLLLDYENAYDICNRALEQGFHIAAHAIGDAAVRLGINVYEKLRKNMSEAEKAVLRIEHAQHFHPSDISRFAEAGITAAVQPAQCISDIPMAEKRIGSQRIKYSYLWKTLLNFGINLAGGSDFPIESFNPLTGIHAFVTRKDNRNDLRWFPEEILSRQEALYAYTAGCSAASGEHVRTGLSEKMPADITILNKNIITCPENDILKSKAAGVYTAGKLSFAGEVSDR